jgi:SAM-dependent methyltransferase
MNKMALDQNILYTHFDAFHNERSPQVLMPVVVELVHPQSILDVGCGLGHWLQAAARCGINDLLGIDNPAIDPNALVIPSHQFIGINLEQPIDLGRRFDMALCLEVAEHLPASAAENLVTSLCRHSNVIVFSAAIPGQGGQNHVNEQWPAYWQHLFESQGFITWDFLRYQLWDLPAIDPWYRQNLLLFTTPDMQFQGQHPTQKVLPLVHPEIFTLVENKRQELEAYRWQSIFRPEFGASLKSLLKSIRHFIYR